MCAYADDLAVVCGGEDKLKQAIKLARSWGVDNKIALNNKKSGVVRIKRSTEGSRPNSNRKQLQVPGHHGEWVTQATE